MDEKEMKQISLGLMGTAESAYLGTVDEEGFPQIRAMVNLRNKEQFGDLAGLFEGHDEDFLMYFTTAASSVKMGHIKANPKVSVYFCDPKEICGLMLAGEIEVVTDAELEKALWQEDWRVHFPNGADDPEYTILRLLPCFARGWCMQGPIEFKLK